jgi:hypothetical protein
MRMVHDNYPSICHLLNIDLGDKEIRVIGIQRWAIDTRTYWKIAYGHLDDLVEQAKVITTEPEREAAFPTREVLAKLRLLA